MNNSNFFRVIFESIPDYKKIIFLLFLIKNDKVFLLEIGLSERENNRLNLGFKNIVLEQQEKYMDYVKNEDESVIEKFLNK